MLFGVKSWRTFIKIFVALSSIWLLFAQQLVAQINRGGVKRDTTLNTVIADTLNQEKPDSIEVFELSYEEKYKSIRFTTSQEYFKYQNVDTLFDVEHQFDPINDLKLKYNNIGILGSPVYDMMPDYSSKLHFDLGFNQFKPCKINADSIEIYKVNAPYTKLIWRFGSKEQQFFKVLHANRIKEVLQFGISINRISGEGFYANQKVRNSGFSAYTDYDSKNKKYKLLTTFTSQAYVQEHNGGISEAYLGQIFSKELNTAGQLIATTQPHRRDIVNTNFSDLSGTSNSFGRNNGLNLAINQYFNFGKYFTETATDSTLIKRFVPQFRLKHKIAFEREDHVFEGKNESNYFFYPTELRYDANTYLDSIRTSKWINQLALIQTGKTANKNDALNLPFKSVLSLNYERITVKRLFADTLKFNNTWLAFNATDNLVESPLSFSIDAQYGIGVNNYQSNKIFLKAKANYQLPQSFGKVGISITANSYNAALLYQNYDSNFYNWQNNFNATNANIASLNYSNQKYKLSINASRINFSNLPYFFYDALDPVNINTSNGNLYRIEINKAFKFGWLKMQHHLTFQTENNNDIDLPNWLYNGSFYYSGNWFKRALNFNTGFDVRYLSNFNLPYYNPVIGQFYYQSNVEYALYPTIDFFINFKIQTAVLFFKVEYLNQNWFQRGYYTAVNYPAPDYTFRGGISWRFFD